MILSVTSRTSEIAQFLTLLVVFIFVLFLCAVVAKWMGNVQKDQGSSANAEVIDTIRIAQGKWVQIIRVGSKYKVIAVCKDTVTYLGDVDEGDIIQKAPDEKSFSFSSVLSKAFADKKNEIPEKDSK